MRDFDFDPQRLVDAVKRVASDAPLLVADGFGRLIRDTPPDRLEQLMRSPARKPLLDGIFWQMPKQLDAEQAKGLQTTIRWCISGRGDESIDVYTLELDHGRGRVVRGPDAPEPRLTITMDGVEFLGLVSGNTDAMQAYFSGRIQLAGDIMIAAKLAQLFRMPGGGGPANGGSTPHP
ncbi:MAG: SCP2 sterol-binding domain-containing protein [Actinomycetota bacterium]|nr:SCP2 sterol-binding domain-containing protein [Actinomycetota bacterium]